MTKTHFEQIHHLYAKERKESQKFLDVALEEGHTPGSTIAVVNANMQKLVAWKMRHKGRVIKRRDEGDLVAVDVGAKEGAQAGLYILLGALDRIVEHMLSQQSDPYSYAELSASDDYQAMFNYIATNMMGGSFITQAVTIYHMLSHERAGKRVYSVSDGLGWQLDHTELRGLRASDLRLPYENVYIEVPKAAGLRVFNSESGWHRCVGMYVTEDSQMDVPDRHHGLYDSLVALEGGKFRSWRVMAVGLAKGVVNHGNGIVEIDDALSYFRVPLIGDQPLDTMIDIADAEQRRAENSRQVDGWDKEMREEWKRLFRWVMNAMLYATHTDKGEHWMANKEAQQLWQRIQKIPGKSKKKKTRLSQRLNGLDQQRRILLGSTVVVDRHLMRQGEPGGKGAPLMVRTRVSGHWRNQPHGPGRSLRNLVWIEPFWRGPEDAPVSSPTHEMR